MSEERETTPFEDACPDCGAPLEEGVQSCPNCNLLLRVDPNMTPTNVLPRDPSLWPDSKAEPDCFEDETVAVFQFLPSGTCVSYTLDQPVVVGRRTAHSDDQFLDLSPFQGERHGISRQHCRFWRQEDCLLVADLGSTNGTYLNGERITPFRPYLVRDNTRLILGSLHVVVAFARGC